MRQPPRPRNQALLSGSVLVRAYLVLGLAEALVAMAGYLLVWAHHGLGLAELRALAPALQQHTAPAELTRFAEQASTLTFVLIVAGQMGVLIACRSTLQPFWQRLGAANPLFWGGLVSEPLVASALVLLPGLAPIFAMAPLPTGWLAWLGLPPLAVLLADTLHKRLLALRRGPDPRRRPAHA